MASVEHFRANYKSMATPNRLPSTVSLNHYPSNDPITSFEIAELLDPSKIDNSGRGIIRCRNPMFEIVDKYELGTPEGDNQANGTTHDDGERYAIAQEYLRIIKENLESVSSFAPRPELPADMSFRDVVYGGNGVRYREVIGKDGELLYLDSEHQCVMPKSIGLGDTTPLTGMDVIYAMGEKDSLIKYKVAADGTVTRRTAAEEAIQMTLSEIDKQVDASMTIAFAPLPVSSSVADASASFNAAAPGTGTANTQPMSVVVRKDLTPAEQAIYDITRSKTKPDTTGAFQVPENPALAIPTTSPAANEPQFLKNGTAPSL